MADVATLGRLSLLMRCTLGRTQWQGLLNIDCTLYGLVLCSMDCILYSYVIMLLLGGDGGVGYMSYKRDSIMLIFLATAEPRTKNLQNTGLVVGLTAII